MRENMYRVYQISTAILFVFAESFWIFAIFSRHQFHLEHQPGLFLVPVFVAMPLVTAIRAYKYIKIHLSKNGVDQTVLARVLYDFSCVVMLGYVALVLSLGLLLLTLQSITKVSTSLV